MISSSDLQSLVTAHLISSEQSQAILTFQGQQKESGSTGFSQSIVTIGSILIGLGILSLVALNRDGMTDLLKIGVMLLGMLVTYLFGRYFKQQQKSLLGGSLLFLSGLFVGTSIFLIAQIYNLTVTNDILLGIWILMILPLVYVLRQKEFYYLYMILLSCVLAQFLMSHVFQVLDERNTFVLYMIFGFIMIVAGYIHDTFYDDPLLAKLYKVFGANIAMIAYFIFIVMTSTDIFNDSSNQWLAYNFAPVIAWIIAGVSVLALLYYFWKKQQELLRILGSFLVLIIGLSLSHIVLINYAIFILLCLLLIYLGHQHHNTAIIKTANIYLYIFLLYLYGKYGREYENKALFFIVGGVLMIGLGLGFSKLNKMIGNVLVSNNANNVH